MKKALVVLLIVSLLVAYPVSTLADETNGYQKVGFSGNSTYVTIGFSAESYFEIGFAANISNTPSSWNVNSGAAAVAGSTHSTGLDWGNLTNLSSFAVDVTIQGEDLCYDGYCWYLNDSGAPSAGNCSLKAGVYSSGLGGNWTVKSSALIDSTGWSNQRKIARDSTGRLYTAYHRTATKKNIFVSYSDNNGQTWTEEQVTSDATYDQLYPTIAVDSSNSIHLSWYGKHSDSTTYTQIRYAKRSGGSWGAIGNLTTDNYNQNFPSIVIDGSDYVHIVWHGKHAESITYTQIRYIKYTDSWQSVENVTSSTYGHQQYASIAVDSASYIHVAWERIVLGYAYHQIGYIKSTGTWGDIQTLTTESYYQALPTIAIDSSNSVHITWFGQHAGSTSYSQVRYIQYSGSWGTIQNLTSESYDQVDPMISLDSDNDIHIVWWGLHAGSETYEQVRHIAYTGSWSSIENITNSGVATQGYPNIIWAKWPVVSNLRPNTPVSGFAFVWMDGTTITYYQSSNLEWDSQYDVIVKRTAPYNDLVTSLPAGNSTFWGMVLYAPISYSNPSSGNQLSGNITLTAEASQ